MACKTCGSTAYREAITDGYYRLILPEKANPERVQEMVDFFRRRFEELRAQYEKKAKPK